MTRTTRRDFVRTTAAAGVATALDRGRILGANDRIRVGLIDGGGRGRAVWERFLYDFPEARLGGGKGCVVSWTGREIGSGRDAPLVFHGTKGALTLSRRGFAVRPEVWKADPKNEKPAMEPLEGAQTDLDLPHTRDFLDCVKSRRRPIADVEEGHLTAAMCHLGNIATRLGRSLHWNAEKEEVVGDADASARLHYEYRKPWTL